MRKDQIISEKVIHLVKLDLVEVIDKAVICVQCRDVIKKKIEDYCNEKIDRLSIATTLQAAEGLEI